MPTNENSEAVPPPVIRTEGDKYLYQEIKSLGSHLNEIETVVREELKGFREFRNRVEGHEKTIKKYMRKAKIGLIASVIGLIGSVFGGAASVIGAAFYLGVRVSNVTTNISQLTTTVNDLKTATHNLEDAVRKQELATTSQGEKIKSLETTIAKVDTFAGQASPP